MAMVGAGNANGEINLGMTQVLRQRQNVVQAPQIDLNPGGRSNTGYRQVSRLIALTDGI